MESSGELSGRGGETKVLYDEYEEEFADGWSVSPGVCVIGR